MKPFLVTEVDQKTKLFIILQRWLIRKAINLGNSTPVSLRSFERNETEGQVSEMN